MTPILDALDALPGSLAALVILIAGLLPFAVAGLAMYALVKAL